MNQNNQQVVKFLITILIIAALLSSTLILASENLGGSTGGKVIAICLLVILYSMTASICWAVTRKREHSMLGTIGMAFSGLGFFLGALVILAEIESETLLKLAFSLMIASIAMAHISFLFYINARNRYTRMARTTATIFITVFSLMIISKVFGTSDIFDFYQNNDMFARILITSLILDLSATVLVALCNRLDPDTSTELELGNPNRLNDNPQA